MQISRQPNPHQVAQGALAAWLLAESEGRDAAAETWLRRAAVAGAFPSSDPRPGFADRVLLATGLEPLRAAWPLRLVVVALALGLALGCLFLLPAVGPLVSTLDPLLPLSAAGSLLLAAAKLLASAARLWDAWAGIAHGFEIVLRTPTGMQVLAACAAISLMALRLLFVLAPERSPSHAPARVV